MATLAEIRAKLKDQEVKPGGSSKNRRRQRRLSVPELKEGEQATVRFRPDGDKDNTFFRKERLMIKLLLPGIKGDTDPKTYKSQVHVWKCMEKLVPHYPKSEVGSKILKLEDMGRKY